MLNATGADLIKPNPGKMKLRVTGNSRRREERRAGGKEKENV